MLKFYQKEKQIGRGLLKKLAAERKRNSRLPLISFDYLDKKLNRDERKLLEKIISVNPKDYGKKYTIFYGINPVPKNLIEIKNQKYWRSGKIKKIKTQFLPKPVFETYRKMSEAMKKEIGGAINVASGYRSPAYQALVLFNWLLECKWDIKKALRRVTLPGCSEHGNPARQAVDFSSVKGIKSSKFFYKTKEYKWLLKNAKKFGFFLSYRVGNKFGVDFEPWHWHFESKNVLIK